MVKIKRLSPPKCEDFCGRRRGREGIERRIRFTSKFGKRIAEIFKVADGTNDYKTR